METSSCNLMPGSPCHLPLILLYLLMVMVCYNTVHTEGLKCYNCPGVKTTSLGECLEKDSCTTCTYASGKGESGTEMRYTRSCSIGDCDAFNKLAENFVTGTYHFCCEADLCNSAPYTSSMFSRFLLVIAVCFLLLFAL